LSHFSICICVGRWVLCGSLIDEGPAPQNRSDWWNNQSTFWGINQKSQIKKSQKWYAR